MMMQISIEILLNLKKYIELLNNLLPHQCIHLFLLEMNDKNCYFLSIAGEFSIRKVLIDKMHLL